MEHNPRLLIYLSAGVQQYKHIKRLDLSSQALIRFDGKGYRTSHLHHPNLSSSNLSQLQPSRVLQQATTGANPPTHPYLLAGTTLTEVQLYLDHLLNFGRFLLTSDIHTLQQVEAFCQAPHKYDSNKGNISSHNLTLYLHWKCYYTR